MTIFFFFPSKERGERICMGERADSNERYLLCENCTLEERLDERERERERKKDWLRKREKDWLRKREKDWLREREKNTGWEIKREK